MRIHQTLKKCVVVALLPCLGIMASVSDAAEPGALVEATPVASVADESGNWYQAGEGKGENRISNVVRAHWTSVDENGTLSGKISAIVDQVESRKPTADMRVYLARNGQVVADVATDNEGVFNITNVVPGSYSIVARNDEGFMAFGLNVLPYSAEYENFVRIDSAIVPVNFDAISLENGVTPPVAIDRFAEKTNTYSKTVDSIVKSDQFADAIPASSLVAHKVALTADGRMMGRVRKIDHNGQSRIVSGAEIVILSGDKEVGRAVSDSLGVFEVTGLEPQAYSLIASCQQGFAAVGFELVSNDETALLETQGAYTSMQCSTCSMDVGLAGPVDFGYANTGCATCGGGFGGGGGLFGGGGFGGGGGGGLLGRPGLFRRVAILGLVGGAIALAVTSGDDDDGGGVVQPASPTTP